MRVGLSWEGEGRMAPTLDGTRREEFAPTSEGTVALTPLGPPILLNGNVPRAQLERRRVQFPILIIISSPWPT